MDQGQLKYAHDLENSVEKLVNLSGELVRGNGGKHDSYLIGVVLYIRLRGSSVYPGDDTVKFLSSRKMRGNGILERLYLRAESK